MMKNLSNKTPVAAWIVGTNCSSLRITEKPEVETARGVFASFIIALKAKNNRIIHYQQKK